MWFLIEICQRGLVRISYFVEQRDLVRADESGVVSCEQKIEVRLVCECLREEGSRILKLEL